MDSLILKYKNLYENFSVEDDDTIEKFIDFIYTLNENEIQSRVLVSIYKREIIDILNIICNKYPKVNNKNFYEIFNKLDIKQIIIDYFVHNYKTHYNFEVLNLYFHYNEKYKVVVNYQYLNIRELKSIFLRQVYFYLNKEIGYYSNTQIEYKNFFDMIYYENYKDLSTSITLKLT